MYFMCCFCAILLSVTRSSSSQDLWQYSLHILKGVNYPSNSLPKKFNIIMLLEVSSMPFGITTTEAINTFVRLYFLIYFKARHT